MGWHQTVVNQQQQMERLAHSLVRELQVYTTSSRPPQPTPLREIVEDLAGLEQEFPDVEIDLRSNKLSVTSDDIELEGVYLGPFKIVLNWNSIGDYRPYEVIAIDPRPAGSDSGTTHPHVHDDALCEGEGRLPIQQALLEGRLFDFFLLVRQILNTYNAGSAYVALSQWNGVECRDCGYSTSDDESTDCSRCGSVTCYDCSRDCNECGRALCGDCRTDCPGCGNGDYCDGCLYTCDDCGETMCRDCLVDGLCEDCDRASQENNDDEQSDQEQEKETQSVEAGAAVQPVCVGETVVPA
jgi:hypothetical protein